jgi:5-formyltetrahydrofolate cyclo-ligase
MEEKVRIRTEMLAKRDALTGAEKAVMDENICNKLKTIIDARRPKVVHSYLPMGTEVDVRPAILYLLEKDITVIMPKVYPKRRMEHLVLKGLDVLEDGIYGTQHPADNIIHNGEIDMFILPGLAFSKDNYRLGYGGGYYDVFLATQPDAYKLAVCYPFQVFDAIPVETHDVQLDDIIYP